MKTYKFIYEYWVETSERDGWWKEEAVIRADSMGEARKIAHQTAFEFPNCRLISISEQKI